MKYLITLKPLEPYLFGGDNTFGKLGDKENGTYLVSSQHYPQQSALLGMLKKEIMTQSGVLTRKVRGEWVDKSEWSRANTLVGNEKFNFMAVSLQDFGTISSLSPIFLTKEGKHYIKKVDIDSYPYQNGLLENYSSKEEFALYDNYISTDGKEKLVSKNIFLPVEKTGNKKGGQDNSLFKKSAYLLEDGFSFAIYLNCEYALKDSIVTLGADRSSFKMSVEEAEDGALNYIDKNGYLTLLSDSYISLPIKEHCVYAITSEVSFRSLENKKHATNQIAFKKSEKVYLYERGSVFIEPSDALLADINRENLQQVGYNIYTQGEK